MFAYLIYHGGGFEALSYTWGDPTDLLPIEANGETMQVTRNLATALTYLRNISSARHLWIDALCINQMDTDERNAQVAIMGTIYRTARRVVSWLGIRSSQFDPFVEMDYAISFIEQIRFLKEYPPFQKYLEESSSGAERYPEFENHRRAFNNGLYSLQLLIGERQGERLAYWQRAWIIQEVACAQQLLLQSGPYLILEEDIDLVVDFLSSPKVAALLMDGRYEYRKFRARLQSDMFFPLSIYRSLRYPDAGETAPSRARIRGPLSLLTLLRHGRGRFCANARDKVYSILAISDISYPDHSGLVIDYNKPVSEVYLGAARAVIEISCSLEILCSANLSEANKLPGLPSWAPNWAVQQDPDICERPISFGSYHVPSPPHLGITQTASKFRFDGTGRSLFVSGFRFGRITKFKDPLVNLSQGEGETDQKDLSRLLYYAELHKQLSEGYRDITQLMPPSTPLPPDLYRNTCSLGMLRNNAVEDAVSSFMKSLDLRGDGPDDTCEPVDFSQGRAQLKLMASAIDKKCMFVVSVERQAALQVGIAGVEATIGVAAPGIAKAGDLVCFLPGCSVPLVLRPIGSQFSVVCACYIDSLIDGRAMCYLEQLPSRVETFELV
ncbi:unnamed protein product [Clonostachys byssicola]|uniref:Heterokaryon incompatibility domain-containing protein n=1 Tax=Clonostachys byssicola TaxID=160290 RepID=A0A9N9UCC2_9HYPO|nr:unnamed protein product [Clonostachys byssicola]